MGGSGGGGSSGEVGYPAYMESLHWDWLDDNGADNITSSITAVMNVALAASPWAALTAYNPAAPIAAYEAALAAFAAIIAGLSDEVDWAAYYAQADATIGVASEADIVADIAAFSNQLDNEILVKVLPRFRRGMQNINAVVSSAFPIGEAIIEAFRDDEVAKHSSALRLSVVSEGIKFKSMGVEQMINMRNARLGLEESYLRLFIEAMRIKIVALKEQTDQDAKIDEADALWDLEVFQHGGNLLAAVSGGTSRTGKQPSQLQSALGGALAGAAAGAQLSGGNPYAAGAGAIIGAASAFL